MLRRLAVVLGLAVAGLTVTSTSTQARAAALAMHVSIGGRVTALGALSIGGVMVAPRVVFHPDGRIEFGAYAGTPVVRVSDREPVRELIIYGPGRSMRTVVVRDRDRAIYERFLIAHHDRFAWRRWDRRLLVQSPEREVRPVYQRQFQQRFQQRTTVAPGYRPDYGEAEQARRWDDRRHRDRRWHSGY